ncbi:MAG TPA: aminoglycoside phosphotransferase family protein [Gemmata sp.]
MVPAPEGPPDAVVAHFAPSTTRLTWHRAPGGFSGAAVWRGDDSTGAPRVAVKGWPTNTPPERVARAHLWLARAAPLPFVPAVFAGVRGLTAVLADGRLWDASKWMPGAPHPAPAAGHIRAACEAVAQLHLTWPAEPAERPCRGVAGRLEALLTHGPHFAGGRALPHIGPELDSLLQRSARAVARLAGPAVATLRPWEARPVSARPCVRDLRAEHVLFHEGRVTGIVDYGAMGFDNPAADLARLLGDWAGTDPELFGEGLRAYRRAGGPLDVPDEFVRLLAWTGTVCSVLGWLVRIVVRREPVTRPAEVAIRLGEVLVRAERVTHLAPIS